MTREQELEKIIEDTFWMAFRYVDGRRSYAVGWFNESLKKARDLGLELRDVDGKEYAERGKDWNVTPKKVLYNPDDVVNIGNSMIKWGGGFDKSLGEALLNADNTNAIKIMDAFPDAWKKYLELHNSDKRYRTDDRS